MKDNLPFKIHYTRDEATELYNTKKIYYDDDNFDVIYYMKKIFRVKNGFEASDNDKILKFSAGSKPKIKKDDSVISYRSIARACYNIHSIAKANRVSWRSFITLTFADNITDIEYANKKFNNWCSQLRRLYPDFMYLGVPEYQKRGAVHYHLLTNIDCNSDIIPKRESIKTYNIYKKRFFNLDYYNIRFWSYGNSSAFDIIKETDSHFKLELYITKYLYKEFDNRLFMKKKYLYSKNCLKPKIEFDDLKIEEFESLLQNYENDFILTDTKYTYAKNDFSSDMIINKFTL